jgi:sulfite exporter TauE/SafE
MNLITPITIGIIGSMHCVGMCGPIALALPLGKWSAVQRITGLFIYNLGRLTTYGFIGTLFGILGKSFYIAGIQRQISVFMGVLILLVLFLPQLLSKTNKITKWWYKLFGGLYQEMSMLLKKKSFSSLFIIGIINGFLPCGLVYLALAGALAQSEIYNGTLFMVMFGLGTVPVMFGIGWASSYISVNFRNTVKKISPYFIGFFGILLILRGLNLGIYLSPKIEKVGQFIQSCI